MPTAIRRLFLLGATILFAWPLAEALAHRSEDTAILGRYSPPYFAWVVFIVLSFLLWVAAALAAFFRWEWLMARLERLAEQRGLARWMWAALAAIWLPMLAFVLMVDQTASDTTPQSAALPLALLAASSLVIFRRLAIAAQPEHSPDEAFGMVERLAGAPATRRIEAAAARIAGRPRPNAAAIAIITLAAAVALGPALWTPDKLLDSHDLQNLYYPVEIHTSAAMRAGTLPTWNPYLFSGLPHMSHPVTLVYYPIAFVLRLLLPVNLAAAWALGIHLWIAGVGMYALCRSLGLRPWIALLCALVFMLNGEMVGDISAGHVWLVYALAWLPAAWLLVKLALETGSLRALAGASLIVAMLILTGHPTFPGYILLFLGFVWLLHAIQVWQRERRPQAIFGLGARFAAILGLGIGLAAIQVLPTVVLSSESALTSGYDLADANLGALLPQHLTTMFLPDAYGYRGYASWEMVPYLGVLLTLAAPFAFVQAKRRPLAILLGLIALLALALAFGHELRLFSALYLAFPPFRVLRFPPRALVLWVPAMVVLGGLGLEALADKAVQGRWLTWAARVTGGAALIPVGAIAGYLLRRWLTFEALPPQPALQGLTMGLIWGTALLVFVLWAGAALFAPGNRLAGGLLLAALLAIWVVVGYAVLPTAAGSPGAPDAVPVNGARFLTLGALLILSALALRLLHRSGHGALAPLLIGLLVLADLGPYAARHIAVADPPSFTPAERQALAAIPPVSEGRVMVGDTGYLNQLMPLGIGNVDGYYSGMLAGYSLYLRGVAANPPLDTVVLLSVTSYPQLDERALDFLNVTHVLSEQPLDETNRELVGEAPGKFYVYRNPDALPRVFWVGRVEVAEGGDAALDAVLDPGFDYATAVVLEEGAPVEEGAATAATSADVRLAEYDESSGDLLVRTRTSQAGVLVMSEPYYPERQVWIDGQPARLLRANVAFSAVALPAGEHEVEVRYVPVSFYRGAWISLGSVAICAGLALYEAIKQRALSNEQR